MSHLNRSAMSMASTFMSILNGYRVDADVRRTMKLTERIGLVATKELPGSSRYSHAVPIGVGMVDAMPYTDFASSYSGPWFATYELPVNSALAATVGEHECWFNEAGEAFISFADKQDAMMFRLALDGDLS